MNKIYKVVWSDAKQQWVVVSELGKTQKKTKSTVGGKVKAAMRAAILAGTISLSGPISVLAAETNIPAWNYDVGQTQGTNHFYGLSTVTLTNASPGSFSQTGQPKKYEGTGVNYVYYYGGLRLQGLKDDPSKRIMNFTRTQAQVGSVASSKNGIFNLFEAYDGSVYLNNTTLNAYGGYRGNADFIITGQSGPSTLAGFHTNGLSEVTEFLSGSQINLIGAGQNAMVLNSKNIHFHKDTELLIDARDSAKTSSRVVLGGKLRDDVDRITIDGQFLAHRGSHASWGVIDISTSITDINAD